MRKFLLLIFILAGALGTIANFYIVPKTQKFVTALLHDRGFTHAQIGTISYSPTGISIDQITLDEGGFNKIENVRIDFLWPFFLLHNDIQKTTIHTLQIVQTFDEFKNTLLRSKKLKISDNLFINGNATIHNITYDIATNQKAIRLTGNAEITQIEDIQKLKVNIDAAQHELAFQSQWFLNHDQKDNNIVLDGNVSDLKINHQNFNIVRADGWLSYQQQTDNIDLSAQIDAGSGRIFKVPAKNINLLISNNEEGFPILFRAEAAGIKGVSLSADYAYLKNKDSTFASIMNIENTNAFIKALQTQEVLDQNLEIPSLNNLNMETVLNYKSDKRFADGPLPFDVNIQNRMNGTFLIYPKSMDIRGTLDVEEENFLKLLRGIFNIPEEQITENVIRIDGNVKSLIH